MLIDKFTLKKLSNYNELSARIDGFPVWLRVPADVPLVESPEPFLAVGFLEALSRGEVIRIDSDRGISQILLAHLEELNLIYCNWNHDFSPVSVDVVATHPHEPTPGVATMYSAGVDSMFTLLRHQEQITHMLRMFGYDFHDEAENIASIIEHDIAYAKTLGKIYIPVQTNFRKYMEDRNIDNESFWGFPLYATALALGFETCLIPSSHTYSELFPASSHPLTDPLWSNGQVKFVHDILVRRSEKIEKIVEVSKALENLHVCWKLPIENCGRCSKCIRTGVTLRLLGVTTDSIPLDTGTEMLGNIQVRDESGLTFLEDNLILAQEKGNTEIERILLKKIRGCIRSQAFSQLGRIFLGRTMRRLYRRWRKPEWISAITLVQKERPY